MHKIILWFLQIFDDKNVCSAVRGSVSHKISLKFTASFCKFCERNSLASFFFRTAIVFLDGMQSLLKAPLKLSAAGANEAVFLYHAPRVWLRQVQDLGNGSFGS